ncbi:MAG: Rieske (2Fe-2S) protein [Armatimonadota bacterium]
MDTSGPLRILLIRQDGQIHALADTCAHLGCSLAEGTLQRQSITCRCHG